MNVRTEIAIYEIDGDGVTPIPTPRLVIESHPLWQDHVTLRGLDGHTFTVMAGDLEMAIRNATNVRR